MNVDADVWGAVTALISGFAGAYALVVGSIWLADFFTDLAGGGR